MTGMNSVEVIGIDDAGFCISRTHPVPDLSDSVIHVSVSNSSIFSATAYTVNPGDSVFVRAFAIKKGKTYFGKTLRTVIVKNPAPQVPCSLTKNRFEFKNNWSDLNSAELKHVSYNDTYKFTANFSDGTIITLLFYERLRAGTYAASENNGDVPRKMFYGTIYNFNLFSNKVLKGQKIYVTENSPGKFSIDFCNVLMEPEPQLPVLIANFSN